MNNIMGLFAKKKKMVLIIDDSPDVGEILKTRLEANAFTALTALSGKDGIEKALTNPVDVIILDIMMPEMDGFEVAKQLKKNDKTKTIPVIMLSALGSNFDPKHGETMAKAKELGVAGFVTKPYIPADVLSAINKALE